jgi:hypothetical protein
MSFFLVLKALIPYRWTQQFVDAFEFIKLCQGHVPPNVHEPMDVIFSRLKGAHTIQVDTADC